MTKIVQTADEKAAQLAAHVEDYMTRTKRTSITMTDATEAIWGTSGRGNPNAVLKIEAVAHFGWLQIQKVGARKRIVTRTSRPLPKTALDYIKPFSDMPTSKG